MLRPARGRAHRAAAGLRPDARGPGRGGPRGPIDGAGDGPAPADDTDPSNPGHGGPFDEDDPDRRARTARRRGGRHDVDAGGPRRAAGVGPGRRGPPDPRTAGASASSRCRTGAGRSYDGKGYALLEIARAQLKLGDRAAALATLRLLDDLAEPRPPKPGAKADLRAWERFAALAESAEVRRDAGDLDGARAALDRAARYLDVLDHGAVRGAIERVGKEIETVLAKKAEALQRLSDEEAAFISEASFVLIDQCIALGDMALARTLIRRTARGGRAAAGAHEGA